MASEALQFRLAQPSDDAQVGELLVRSFVDTYAVKMPEVLMTARRETELRDLVAKRSKGATWVAHAGLRIVGTVFLARPGAEGSLAWLPDGVELKHL
ncbi:N-acetyltransferase, partial [bacterium]|nr:N-acetyltransferase [bacterium]